MSHRYYCLEYIMRRIQHFFQKFFQNTVPIGYSDLGYSDLNPNGSWSLHYINSDHAVYSDLNPRDRGQLLYPMCTVIQNGLFILLSFFFLYFIRSRCQEDLEPGF